MEERVRRGGARRIEKRRNKKGGEKVVRGPEKMKGHTGDLSQKGDTGSKKNSRGGKNETRSKGERGM